MKKTKKKALLVFCILFTSLIFNFPAILADSVNNDSLDNSDTINTTIVSSKKIINRNLKNIQSELSYSFGTPNNNLFDFEKPYPAYSDSVSAINRLEVMNQEIISIDKSTDMKLTVDNTPTYIQIYFERLDGNITTYGLAGETLEVHVIVKGLISSGDTLNLDVRRDIVSFPDSDLYNGYYDFTSDLLGSESLHIYWTITLDPNQDDFGLGFGDIRSYFLIVYLDSEPTLFDGSGVNTHRLWMCGDLMLYGVQYYNYTTEGDWVPVSYSIPGWDIFVTFYVAVVNAPIWGFDIQGVIKADVVWGIDETLYSDDEKTISGLIEPGIYYYNWSDTGGNPYYFTVPDRSYGNLPGDTRCLFGVLFMDSNEIPSLDPDYTRDELHIIPNTIAQPPIVQIELPLDGYVTYNDTLSLSVDLIDPNSNYDITSVEILVEGIWLDATAFYDTTLGRLDVYVTNAFTTDGIKNITVKAEDSNGNIGFDSVIIQYFTYGYFFPQDYTIENRKESLDIFAEEFRYDHLFNWGDEENNITITPYFAVSIEATVDYELLLAYPTSASPGQDFTAYLKVANPEIHLSIVLDLGVEYTFSSGENYYFGSSSLYEKEVSKSLALGFGVFRIDLRDISPLIASITHLEIETKDFLPDFIDWLANFKFEIDFIPLLKIKNLLSFDISGINCNPSFSSLSITTDSLYSIPCAISAATSGEDEVTLTLNNFSIDAAAGFEAYCQMTFSGKLLGIPIGPIDVNEWLFDYFGIKVPYLDVWLLGSTLPFGSTVSVMFPLTPVSLSVKIIDMFYSLDNITYKFELKDVNDNTISGAMFQVDDYSQTYLGTEETSGIYVVVMDYYDQPETITLTVSKTGYITLVTSIELYVDPPAVTKAVIWEYTLVSIGIVALVASVATIIIFRFRRRV